MYKGKMTNKLNKLFEEYYKKFQCYPDEYDDIEYFDNDYDELIKDIEKSLKENKEIEEILRASKETYIKPNRNFEMTKEEKKSSLEAKFWSNDQKMDKNSKLYKQIKEICKNIKFN